MLYKIRLLVAGGHIEIGALRNLIRTLGAERGVSKNNIEAAAIRDFIDRVPPVNLWLQSMQIKIHQSEPAGPCH